LLPALGLALLLVFLIMGPWAWAKASPVTRYQLKNGLTVLLQPIPGSPAVSVSVLYKVGSRNERPGMTGASFVLEHILQKNTRQYPKGRMAALLNRVGADFNAFTSNDVTGFYETLAPEYLELALHIEADRMKNGIIDAASLAVEKNVALSESSGYRNQPSFRLWEQVRALAFVQHPYKWPVQGFEEDVKNLTPDMLTGFYRSYYRPDNAVIAVVGNFDPKEARTLIDKFFSGIRKPDSAIGKVSVAEPPQAGEKSIVIRDMGRTSILQIAYRTPAVSSQDLFAMAVIDGLLVGGRSPRLKSALVSQGYTRNADAWLDTNVDPGLYLMRFNLRQGKTHQEVEKIVAAELERLKTEPVPPEELQRAKNRLKADFIRAKDSVTFQARYLAWYEGIFSYKYLEDYPAGIDRVTSQDVSQAASRYFTPQNRSTGRLYPLKSSETPDADPAEEIKGDEGDQGGIPGAGRLSLSFPSPASTPGKLSTSHDLAGAIGGSLWQDGLQLAAAPKKKYFAPKKKKAVPAKKKSASSTAKKKAPAKAAPKKSPVRKPAPARKYPQPTYRPVPSPSSSAAQSQGAGYVPPMPEPRPFDLKFTRHVLSNGLVLLVHQNRANPSVALKCIVKAGGMYEPAGKGGISKITAHLLQKGSIGLTAAKLSEGLDDLGAELSVGSTLQNCELGLWTPSEHLERAVPMLAEVMTRPVFSQDELDRVRSGMKTSLVSLERNSSIVSTRDFFAGIFPDGHPFHHFRWGNAQALDSISREDVARFHSSHFRPDSTIIAISGDVDPQQAVELFQKSMGSWKGQGEKPQLLMSPVALPQAATRRVNTLPDLARVQVVMGHLGIPRSHPDFYRFNLMNYILGGGPLVTRLGSALRDKGLAYRVCSRLDTSIGEGPWAITMTLAPQNVDSAISAAEAQVKNLQAKPPSPQELQNARLSILGSLPVSLETNSSVASMLLTMEYYRLGEDYFRNYHRVYKAITADDVQQTAKKYLHPDKMNIVITGPYKQQ
jgi:zinc protease